MYDDVTITPNDLRVLINLVDEKIIETHRVLDFMDGFDNCEQNKNLVRDDCRELKIVQSKLYDIVSM